MSLFYYNRGGWFLAFGSGAALVGLIWLIVALCSSTPQQASMEQSGTEVAQTQEQKPVPDPPKVYVYTPPPIEVEYRKEYAEGEIQVVKYNGDGPYSEEKLADKPNPHYVPDWTDITYLPPGDDTEEITLQVCGNVLKKYNPHQKINIILHATNVGDYNDCYNFGAPLTFGGKPEPPANATQHSVPGSK